LLADFGFSFARGISAKNRMGDDSKRNRLRQQATARVAPTPSRSWDSLPAIRFGVLAGARAALPGGIFSEAERSVI
jgi:hypothetical protein